MIIGNQSSSEAVSLSLPKGGTFVNIGPLSVGFDFCLVSVSAHIKSPSGGGQAGLGLTIGIRQPPPFTAGYPSSASGIDISVVFGVTPNEFYPAGSNYYLGAECLDGATYQIQGASAGAWDIWGDAEPAPVPAAPGAPSLTPLSMTSWAIAWTNPDFTTSASVERSTDNGASWSTIASGLTGAGYTDTTVPAGPLRYRVTVSNSQGGSTSAVAIAGAPGLPGAPTVTETLQ